MIKRLLFTCSALMPLLFNAQVTLHVQLPPGGMLQKDQLWNLVLTNNNNEMTDMIVSLNLQDAVTGQTVLSATTRYFTIGKGVKLLNFRDIQPVQYNYLAAEISGNFIPLGSYIACYRVVKRSKADQPIADECVRLNINPLSPPLLNTPADKSVLQTAYPQFSWTPPTPSELFSNLNYDISVVEIREGQSAADALLANSPVYTNSDLKVPFESFSSSYASLEKGKNYAWQVTAKNGFNYSAQTEVWTFTLQSPDTTKISFNDRAYILARDKTAQAGINFITNRELLVKYYSFESEHEAMIEIVDAAGRVMQEFRQKVRYGDNFLVFEINKRFQEGKVYTLQITDLQRNKFTVQFSIKK